MNQSLSRHVALLVVLLVLLGLVSFTASSRGTGNDAVQTQGEAISGHPVPPITPTMQAVLDRSVGFSAFVSYTDDGFEPSEVSIQKGQSIRFTNNSSHKLWLSAVAKNGIVYPSGEDTCGQSSFDSCIEMPPNEIWEFTFEVAGTWGYRNNSEQTHVGVVRVK